MKNKNIVLKNCANTKIPDLEAIKNHNFRTGLFWSFDFNGLWIRDSGVCTIFQDKIFIFYYMHLVH